MPNTTMHKSEVLARAHLGVPTLQSPHRTARHDNAPSIVGVSSFAAAAMRLAERNNEAARPPSITKAAVSAAMLGCADVLYVTAVTAIEWSEALCVHAQRSCRQSDLGFSWADVWGS